MSQSSLINSNKSSSPKIRNHHFLKLNDIQSQQPQQQQQQHPQRKSNGHIDNQTATTAAQQQQQPSSPLIGKNYPHQRVTKSPSSIDSTKSSSSSSSNRCNVINLNPVNHHPKQNSYDYSSKSPNLNSPSKLHRHSFRCTTTNQSLIHTYDNVYNNNSNRSEHHQQESSPKFIRKNFLRNSLSNNSAQQTSTYGQIISQSNLNKLKKDKNKINDNVVGENDDSNDDEQSSYEWIEIFEPKSRTKMFANLITGECSWQEPKGVYILRQSDPKITQWWELYDQKSQRYYYYSVKDSKTIWRKPDTVDAIVVPLARLQIIKQSTTDNSSPLERILSSSTSSSTSPSSSINQRLAIMASSNSNFCVRCRQQTQKKMVDSSTQTSTSGVFFQSKQPMVSRWTQTTSQTPIDIRRLPDLLSDDNRRRSQQQFHQQIQPSLRHYLLSEARFAARGQTSMIGSHLENIQDDRIYDPIAPESIYDPVAHIDDDEFDLNEDYCHYYDDEFDDDFSDYDEDDEVSFDSCDADDEFGDENSYTEDEDDDADENDAESLHEQRGSSSDSHLVGENNDFDDNNYDHVNQQQKKQENKPTVDDYDSVDYEQNHFESSTANDNLMPSSISSSATVKQNSDGPIRMSESFTATDLKRNILGRGSFMAQQQRPSLSNIVNNYNNTNNNQSHHHQQQLQDFKPSAKPTYSNPFDNNGSIRNKTGLIYNDQSTNVNESIKGLGSIADRIQLFNLKSSKTPISPKSVHRQQSIASVLVNESKQAMTRGSLHRSATTESGDSNSVVDNQVQQFLRQQQQNSNKICEPSPTIDQTSMAIPSKSTSMTLISPPAVIHSNEQMNNVTNEKRSSLNSKFPMKTTNSMSNNQFDLSIEMSRNNSSASLSPSQTHRSFGSSTPIPSSYPIPPPHLHHHSSSAFNQAIIANQTNAMGSSKHAKSKTKLNKVKNVNANNKDQTIVDGKSSKKSAKSNAFIKDKSTNGNNSIESFARECVSRHRKGGIFSKKKTLKSMLIHTKKPLKKPMISTISDAVLVKESVLCFKMIQIFMGDRSPSPIPTQPNQSAVNSNNININNSSMTGERLSPIPLYIDDQLLVRLINICVTLVPLRDEVLVQVARQVTQNPDPNSERRGLELMCTLFWYFTASNKLAQHLHAFLQGHRNAFTAIVRRKFEQQLHRSRYTHSHLFYRKPHSNEEVARVLRAVHVQHVGIFGETLYDAMVESSKLPWPVVLLTEALLEPRHDDREGVFRCVGDMDDVHRLKMKLDTILPDDRHFNQMIGLTNDSSKIIAKLTDDHDIHVIASTLKLYFRELRDSIIPSNMYLQALDCAHDPEKACALLDKLEPLNRSTLRYLIHFLQIFSTNEFVRYTKMDDANLSMVWAPNILRSPNTTTGQQQSGPAAAKAAMINSANIYEHTRAEMSFVRTLIQHLPTDNQTETSLKSSKHIRPKV